MPFWEVPVETWWQQCSPLKCANAGLFAAGQLDNQAIYMFVSLMANLVLLMLPHVRQRIWHGVQKGGLFGAFWTPCQIRCRTCGSINKTRLAIKDTNMYMAWLSNCPAANRPALAHLSGGHCCHQVPTGTSQNGTFFDLFLHFNPLKLTDQHNYWGWTFSASINQLALCGLYVGHISTGQVKCFGLIANKKLWFTDSEGA